MKTKMAFLELLVVIIFANCVSCQTEVCDACAKNWIDDSCQVYCCQHAQVCDTAEEFPFIVTSHCGCPPADQVHEYCSMAAAINVSVSYRHAVCNMLSGYTLCASCLDLPDLTTTTTAATTTADATTTLAPGETTAKPVSKYCAFKQYCKYLPECTCEIEEPDPTTAAPRTSLAATESPVSVTECAYSAISTTCESPGYVIFQAEVTSNVTLPLCNGILLNSDTIVTSRKCALDMQEILANEGQTIVAQVGATTLTDGTEIGIYHNEGDIEQLSRDIFTLKTTNPIEFSEIGCVLPACTADYTMDIDTKDCHVYSHGSNGSSDLPDEQLQATVVSVMDSCSTNTSLCTVDVATCLLDSGAPLMCKERTTGHDVTVGLIQRNTTAEACAQGKTFFTSLLWETNAAQILYIPVNP